MSQPSGGLRLKLKASTSSRQSGKKEFDPADILSMSWEFADRAFELPGPTAVEQNTQHELGIQQLLNLVGSSPEEDSATITDISEPAKTITLNSKDCMTFHSATDPTKGPTKLYKYARLKKLNFRPQFKRQTPKRTSKSPKEAKKTSSAPPATQVQIQLPVQDHLPIVMKFNQPVKFIVSQEVISQDTNSEVEQKELMEYEFTSDSMQFSPSPDSSA